ncbi:MAG: hypothetical protein ACE5JG_13585, partial [Planctomycetota bacterium]
VHLDIAGTAWSTRVKGAARGPLHITNYGVPTARVGEYAREQVVQPRFTDVAFSLEVGELGIADYDPVGCKHGWYILKRVR